MNESAPLDDDALAQRLVDSRALEEAPEPLVLKAIGLWRRRAEPGVVLPRLLRSLAAVLSFDSALPGAVLAGVRAPDHAGRHLLFSIEGRDVDMRITPSSAGLGAGWAVSGQVLAPEATGRTRLRCGAFETVVSWSELCEFHIEPVPGGDCIVSLETDEWQAVLPAIALPPP